MATETMTATVGTHSDSYLNVDVACHGYLPPSRIEREVQARQPDLPTGSSTSPTTSRPSNSSLSSNASKDNVSYVQEKLEKLGIVAVSNGNNKQAARMSRRVTNGPEPGPLIERFSCLFQNLYCPKTNPSGIVSLGIAENLLCAEEILSFSRKAITENLIQKDLTYGDNLWGSRRLNEALAGFLNG